MNYHRFILGTVQFGMNYGINNVVGKPSKDSTFEMLQFAFDQGIRELDSAEGYGDAHTLIGEYIRTTNQKFNINTKFRLNESTSIRVQLENSLKQLNIDFVKVYFYHRVADLIKHPKSIDKLYSFKEEKLIRKTGVSIYSNEEFEFCINNDGIDVIQIPFNLLDNFSKRGSLISEAKENGKELQVRSVFLQGLFFKNPDTFPPVLKPLSKYIFQLTELALRHNTSLHDLALGYVWNKSGLDQIIIGVDSKEQLKQNLDTTEISFSEQLTKEIDRIVVIEESLLSPINWQ